MTLIALVEFLLARLRDTEADARKLLQVAQYSSLSLEEPKLLGTVQVGWHSWPDVERLCTQTIADCAAKRQIAALCAEDAAEAIDYNHAVKLNTDQWHMTSLARDVVKMLALPYAAHPDYQQWWAP